MSIKVYIAKKFGQDVSNQITQIFDLSQNLTWFNKNTNRTLTNDQYNMLVINEAFNDWQENKFTAYFVTISVAGCNFCSRLLFQHFVNVN